MIFKRLQNKLSNKLSAIPVKRFIHSDISQRQFWKPRFEGSSRRDDDGVSDATRRGGATLKCPKDGHPVGAAPFWAATASLVACVSKWIRVAPRSLFRSKIEPPKLTLTYVAMYK